ncbi:hypothetical protein VTO42DRAFT_5801 [Malbranchea cinnamomea]
MVKADVRRDYYADLGLSPSAETDEIRKQFRKLALKLHPDRNPGREQEFNAKFQAIQEAHEILTDPQRRLKYDTDRLRAGYGRTSGPRKSNAAPQPRKPPFPPTSRTAPFPTTPPPRPSSRSHNWAGPPPSNAYGQPPSAGAQKFSGYARASSAWDKKYDEAKTRADAYRGFQEMKNARPASTGWTNFDPRTGQPTSTASENTKPSRPQTAYEAYHARSTGKSTKKKNGFAPWTPGGDEPMAKSTSAYVNSATRSERFTGYFESATAPTAKKQSDSEETPSMPTLERTSSRYASLSGEKTYVSSRPGKSADTRTPSSDEADTRSRTNPPSPKSPRSERGTRHRSASPQLKPNRSRPVSSTSSSDTDEVLPNVKPRPKAIPRSRKAKTAQNNWGANPTETGFGGTAEFPFFRPTQENLQHQAGQWSDDGMNTKQNTANGSKTHSKGSLNNKPKSKSDESFGARFSFKDWNESFSKDTFQFGAVPELWSRTTTSVPFQPETAKEQDRSRAPSAETEQKTSNPVYTEGKFFAERWSELLKTACWNPEEVRQQAMESRRQKSPKKQPKVKRTTVPKPATVSTEADEAEATLGPEHSSLDSQETTNGGVEVMDIDEDLSGAKAKATPKASDAKVTETPTAAENKADEPSKSGLFDFKKLESVAPFAPTNNSGIDDLQDLKTTLPFESQPADNSRSKVRARDLNLPKPPKPPRPPQLLLISSKPGAAAEPVLMRSTWDKYIAEMEAYMHEWNDFNRKMLGHFNARQNLVETGLAPNWMRAAGDTTRLNIDSDEDAPNKTKRSAANIPADDASDDEQLVFGQPKGGFSAYLRGVEEDFVVREHWSVAWERHRACIYTLGQVRQWIRGGGKVL